MAIFTPPALAKAHGKLSNPAPSADFNMMKIAPREPRRGTSDPRDGLDSILMLRILSRANSSIVLHWIGNYFRKMPLTQNALLSMEKKSLPATKQVEGRSGAYVFKH